MSDPAPESGNGAVDASTVDPEEFARSIADVPDEQLDEAMSGELRPVIIGEVFRRMEEHFRADRAGDTDGVIHWHITGRADGGEDHYEVIVRDGSISITDAPEEEPRVSFKLDGVTFLRLVTGNASGPMLFMTGKLRIQGDLLFAPQVQSLFRIPGVPGPRR